MIWSMNEIESLAKKAARGAGLSWGLAEEAGRATRRLHECGLDGTGALAGLLETLDHRPQADVAPRAVSGLWAARGGTMCPIAAGACLSDHAALLADHPVDMARVAFPLLMLPFAQSAAERIGRAIDLTWDGVCVQLSTEAVRIAGPDTTLGTAEAASVRCTLGEQLSGQKRPFTARAMIAPDTAARLGAFAHRTYAPASEASRLAGAGAGLSDND